MLLGRDEGSTQSQSEQGSNKMQTLDPNFVNDPEMQMAHYKLTIVIIIIISYYPQTTWLTTPPK